jgi:glycosyltransferase involved in cell wall biosynthesis
MKVLFVHYGDDWIAGSEIALLEMIRGLAQRNIEPFLWCNAPAMQQAAQTSGIPVRRDDFAHYFDYSSPPFSPVRYLGLVKKATALISETGAELVCCNSAAPAQWMSLACWRKRVPWLIAMHSPYLRRSRYVLGMHLADEVVAVASAIARPLIADGMDPSRIRIVHNGFDETRLMQGEAKALRAELKIPADAIVGAIAGSLIRRKGHDILFAAMKLLPTPAFHVLVIGDGPERLSFEAEAGGLPVHFLGRRNDLGVILRDGADFLVAPSRQEAFGRVIIEAAFAGIPAIGADVDGIPEAILDEVTGILVPPESPAALAHALSGLIADPASRRRLGQAAQKRAREQFSIEVCADAMAKAFREIGERRNREKSAARAPRRFKPYGNLLRKVSGFLP